MRFRHLASFAALLLLIKLLASCGHTPSEPGDGPGKVVDASKIPDAVPRVEPITKAGNKSPYNVFGKTYHVLPTAKGYSEKGTASWYGSKFHGRNTSNGEVYNMYAMTAAHKTLPIPSYAKVTNLQNGKAVIVRINDRGPFHGSRIIDLSWAAANKLGYANIGTAKVQVEAIDPARYQRNTVEAPSIEHQQLLPAGTYLQVGAFDQLKLADELRQRVTQLVAPAVKVQHQDRLYKVFVGPFQNQNEMLDIKTRLYEAARLSSFTVYQ